MRFFPSRRQSTKTEPLRYEITGEQLQDSSGPKFCSICGYILNRRTESRFDIHSGRRYVYAMFLECSKDRHARPNDAFTHDKYQFLKPGVWISLDAFDEW